MWIIRILGLLAIGYLFICIVTYFRQRVMLYFPNNEPPLTQVLQVTGLSTWPQPTESFRGYVNTMVNDKQLGLVVIFHGNAGAAYHHSFYIRSLGVLGYRLLLSEYPGYGGRSGPLNEKNLIQDAKETIHLAYKQYGGPVYLIGESLGCGVATGVVADPPVPIKGIILITPWDSLPDLAQSIYWFLPARWLVRDKFNNIQNLKHFSGRVAIAAAEHDDVIPKPHTKNLYELISNEKRLWLLKNATHNSWPNQLDITWWEEVMAFLNK